MDKKLKDFIIASTLITVFLVLIILGFTFFYRYSDLLTYNFILLNLLLVTIIITLLFVTAVATVFHVYRKKHVARGFLGITGAALKFLLPFIYIASSVIKSRKDALQSFYITLNNIIVQSTERKYHPDEVLILLPHCLQNIDCKYKVTNDIRNCKRCGRCCIGDIASVAEQAGVTAAVVTGGTAARNVIVKSRPKLVLSVACERDLSSGIADVKKIPVIGLVNERPNGPCINTQINVNELKRRLDSILMPNDTKADIRNSRVRN